MLGHWGWGSGHCPRRQGELALLLSRAWGLHSSSQAEEVIQQDRPRVPWSCRGQVWAGEPQEQQADTLASQEPGPGALPPLLGMGQVAQPSPRCPEFGQGADAQPLLHHN